LVSLRLVTLMTAIALGTGLVAKAFLGDGLGTLISVATGAAVVGGVSKANGKSALTGALLGGAWVSFRANSPAGMCPLGLKLVLWDSPGL